MTTPAHFEVDLAELRTHASTVGDLATQLSSVTGGQQGGPADNALGTFVQFLTAGLQGAMTKITDSVAHASSAMDNVSSGLTRTADGYQHTDEDNAALLRREDVR